MAALTYQYVYFSATGAHTRQPRATNTYGGFTPIPGLNFPSSIDLTIGSPFTVPQNQFPQTEMIGGVTYNFAFMSVVGCTQGGLTSSVYNNYPTGTVGSVPVTVLVVYLPHGGVSLPGGGSGAVIDAFNESTGSLADNNFVTVSPDSGNTLTNSGNVFGFVDTTNSTENISADVPTMQPYLNVISTAIFDRWVILDPTTDPSTYSISGNKLTVNSGKTVFAFAFYKNPPPKHKEGFKENKESYMEGVKQIFEKGGKDLVEYTNPGSTVVDPEAYAKQIQVLVERLTSLEHQIQGQAFIKPTDRPAVGKEVAAKTRKTR